MVPKALWRANCLPEIFSVCQCQHPQKQLQQLLSHQTPKFGSKHLCKSRPFFKQPTLIITRAVEAKSSLNSIPSKTTLKAFCVLPTDFKGLFTMASETVQTDTQPNSVSLPKSLLNDHDHDEFDIHSFLFLLNRTATST